MNDDAKKGLAKCKKLIQEGKHQDALLELEVMGYKHSKVHQIHLLMGFCYQKLNRPLDAEKAYLQVIDLSPNDANALKQLCEIYTQKGDIQKGTKYLQQMAAICKKSDPKKYREVIVKLVHLFEKDCNMEKIDPVFQDYSATEDSIGQDFVQIAKSYFKVGITNQCFFLQKFEIMGMKGDQIRPIIPAAKEAMNRLLIEIVQYLKAVSLTYEMSKKDIANSIMELKMYFPECASLLMMLLFDQYCVGQMAYSSYILGELYYLCQAHFDEVNNYYHNLRYTSPEIFSVCMLLAKEYLCFFKQFFSLEDVFDNYYPKLAGIQDQLQGAHIREEYRKNIDKFILKECRQLSQLSKRQNIELKLSFMKERIEALEDSYLEEIIAKIALHSFTNYDQLNDMKYKLKVRIKQLTPDIISPHLYKYYYDYLIKMARVYKTLDEEIPIQEVLEYITAHDPKDYKYQLQLIWFNFCMHAKEVPEEGKKTFSDEAVTKIKEIQDKLQFSSKSSALRRIMLLKIFGGNHDIEEEVKESLLQQRSFENLQSAAFFYYSKGDQKQALTLLRQAYRLHQSHYHTNRLFFLSLYRSGEIKQAFAFLQQLHSSFNSVFWVNFYLGINKSNQQRFLEAENFMVKSLEAFQAGSVDNFRFYFEKVQDMGVFSMTHLVKQNKYSIFFDELIFSEQFIYKELPILSNFYFSKDVEVNRMKLYFKEGQLLKILGRTKSALNYLEDAYNESLKVQINQQTQPKSLFDHALIRKQYATLLFYSCQFKQAEEMLYSSYTIIKSLLKEQQWPLILRLNEEVQALFFQISISRLSLMMKFESRECVSDYLSRFLESMMNPSQPSLTFLKNKYQFNILEFMHHRNSYEKVQKSVIELLLHFNLRFQDRMTQSFANKLQELDQPSKKFVRESIEDYYIVRGLSKAPLQDQLLHMLSLFPKSSIICVLFGSFTSNIKLKTASFLKVIQLDKESTISMDILASLYLKQKNYLAAAKLFLKSLQTDVLNSKCYLGLAICLFCLIVRAVEEGQKNQLDIVRQCLVRINSYMQFIKLNDPFENYHLLEFLKLLLSDHGEHHFHNKLILQSAQRNCMRYRQTLLGELLRETSNSWKELNFWRSDHHLSIVSTFIQGELQKGLNDHHLISLQLAKKAESVSLSLLQGLGSLSKQTCLKKLQKILHELGLSVCLAQKSSERTKNVFISLVRACSNWQKTFKEYGFSSSDLFELKKQVKSYLYDYILLGDWESQMVKEVDNLFENVPSFDHLIKHYKKIPKFEREIARQLLLNPANQKIREICSGYQVSQKGWNVRKANLSYRLDLQNQNNLNTTEDAHTYKQLFILYRDPQAIILYISSEWNKAGSRTFSNAKKWISLISFILKEKGEQTNTALLEKGKRMRLEMAAFLSVRFNFKVQIAFDQYETEKLDKLTAIFSIMNKLENKLALKDELKKAVQLFKNKFDDFDWWILMTLVSFVSRRVQTTPQFEQFLLSLQNKVSGQLKAFVLLVTFLSTLKKDISTEEELVEQIVKLTQLSSESQDIVSPTTEVILQCSRCHCAGSWEDIETELARAESLRVTSYSDQILVNFFELLKGYKTAEVNPNGEGVIESFIYLADNMLTLIKEPLLQGFVLSLKGMVMSLLEGESRSIKMAMLLSPAAAKGLLGHSE